MATNILRGDAQNRSKKYSITVGGTAAAGQEYTVTINLKEITYTAILGDTNTVIATELTSLLSGATEAEFKQIDFSSSTTVITAEGDDGVEYELTSSATGTGTLVSAVTQTAKGSAFVSDPDNWSLGRVPAAECDPPVQAAPVASSGGSLVDTTTYYWVITATNALGESLKSNQQSLTIAAPNQRVTLSWAQVVGATGYKVYRSTTTNVYTPTALLATISSGSTLTYLDTGTACSTGATPSSNTALGDDVVIPAGAASLKYDLDLGYEVWNSLTVEAGATGQIGLDDFNSSGDGYYEYLPTYLQVAPKTVYLGQGEGSGSSLIRIDTGTKQVSWNVYRTGAPLTLGKPSLYIKGSHTDNTLVIQQGSVGTAIEAGTTARFETIKVGFERQPGSDVTLYIGSGTTVDTSITQIGGVVHARCNIPALTITSGAQAEFTLYGTATMGTLVSYGGTYYPLTSGTHTSVTLNSGATFDKSADARAMTITDATLRDGCTFVGPSVVFTNPFLVDGSLGKMTVDIGSNFHLQKS